MSLILFAIYSSYAIEFVSIEHPGNIANKYGYGALDYLYYIGKYEVTNAQYCDFLNCVAQKADSNRLFSPLMQQHFFGAIRPLRKSNLRNMGERAIPARFRTKTIGIW